MLLVNAEHFYAFIETKRYRNMHRSYYKCKREVKLPKLFTVLFFNITCFTVATISEVQMGLIIFDIIISCLRDLQHSMIRWYPTFYQKVFNTQSEGVD